MRVLWHPHAAQRTYLGDDPIPHNGVVLSSDGTLEGNDVCGFDESQRQTIAQLHGSPHLQPKIEIDVSVIEPKSGAHSDQAASSRV